MEGGDHWDLCERDVLFSHPNLRKLVLDFTFIGDQDEFGGEFTEHCGGPPVSISTPPPRITKLEVLELNSCVCDERGRLPQYLSYPKALRQFSLRLSGIDRSVYGETWQPMKLHNVLEALSQHNESLEVIKLVGVLGSPVLGLSSTSFVRFPKLRELEINRPSMTNPSHSTNPARLVQDMLPPSLEVLSCRTSWSRSYSTRYDKPGTQEEWKPTRLIMDEAPQSLPCLRTIGVGSYEIPVIGKLVEAAGYSLKIFDGE